MDEAQKRGEAIVKSFADLSSWEERYKKIIQLGRESQPLTESYKTKKWLVKGCQSQVWLYAYLDGEGRVIFQADSDALITKGLVAILLKYYSHLPPQDIISHPKPTFLEDLDLANHLTPTRVGGLYSMVRQIQYYAKAFLLKTQLEKTHSKKALV